MLKSLILNSSIFILLLSAQPVCSQSFNVQGAANELKEKRLAKAKESIDLAAANASTANDPKMWYYRGQVYITVYRDTSEIHRSEPNAPEKAAVSFMNCLKTDKGGYYTDDCNNQIWICGVALFNKANDAYNANDLERAAKFYNLIFDIIPLDKDNNLKRNNITPEVLNKNLYLTANKAKDYDKAKGYLQKLIDTKYNDPMIYMYMSNIYLTQKDTATALTFIDQGRKRFDENQKLIDEEIRIYFAEGKTDVLIEKIGKAIEVTPDNEALYFTRGTLYVKKKEFEKAKEDYKKAIELKPDYVDANYNLGAMYFNEAADKLNSISNIKNADEYGKAKEKCEAIFNQSQPYLEKAHEVNPKDRDTMTLLKQLYFRQNNMDKYNKIKAEMDAAGK